jgi:sugar/nucleoside kinase (ribokinase family)
MPQEDIPFDVVCYGTISVDNITHVPRLPNPRRDVTANYEYDDVGGEALRVAMPLAQWGLRVLVSGNVIGEDRKAEFILDELANYPAIETCYVRRSPSVVTPFSRILVTPDGERSRIAYHYDQTPKEELTQAMMQQGRLLSVDAYGRSERDRAAAVARDLGRQVISADAIWPQYPLAGLSDVVIISSIYLQANFPGVFEYDHALELQSMGAGVVIITDGPRPVLVVRADGSFFDVEPYHLDRVTDTSGAGNVFKAGIIYGWLKPLWPLEHKVDFACAAAGLFCQRTEGNAPPPTLDEIAALMRAQPR